MTAAAIDHHGSSRIELGPSRLTPTAIRRQRFQLNSAPQAKRRRLISYPECTIDGSPLPFVRRLKVV